MIKDKISEIYDALMSDEELLRSLSNHSSVLKPYRQIRRVLLLSH